MAMHDWSQSDIARCVEDVLRSRRSVRAYRPDPVQHHTVLEILQAAATAPSNSNTQPWRVYVLSGAAKDAVSEALATSFMEGSLPPSAHFPDPLPQEFVERQADFARRYYDCLEIARNDTVARSHQTQRNFSFFGAPVGLIFAIDARLTRHSWLDLGLFVQNVMIVAKAHGLDTCPQVSFARFHPVLAHHLGMAPYEITVCGMSLGFGEPAAPINCMEMPRLGVDAFVRIVGFDRQAG